MGYLKNLEERWKVTKKEKAELYRLEQDTYSDPYVNTFDKVYEAERKIREIRNSIRKRRLVAIFGK
ncbi:MAG: hypothetical protein NT136_02800 [Candidatus Moranbacteria bacterium]|nr:hypothetical protein [Candidatus Moranbacteria bacterium]